MRSSLPSSAWLGVARPASRSAIWGQPSGRGGHGEAKRSLRPDTHVLRLGVHGGRELLLRHGLSVGVLLVHAGGGEGLADAGVSELKGKSEGEGG